MVLRGRAGGGAGVCARGGCCRAAGGGGGGVAGAHVAGMDLDGPATKRAEQGQQTEMASREDASMRLSIDASDGALDQALAAHRAVHV